MKTQQTYRIIGLMSGSSLDGLDMAYCEFENVNGEWQFKVLQAETATYADVWVSRLRDLPTQAAEVYQQTHIYFGHYCAELVNAFISKNKITAVDFMASHGHTIFHNPKKGYTAQIGDGAAMAALTALPVVCDFRSSDIALGGQGAPLVPVGDLKLFSGYDFCLNLGGICNVTVNRQVNPVAYDIATCNQLLNHLAKKINLDFDVDGKIARSGNINQQLLDGLNQLPFYGQQPPKSLANSFTKDFLIPIIDYFEMPLESQLATATEHIAFQIATAINNFSTRKNETCLATGGGALNHFLVERIQHHTAVKIVLPDLLTIQFKEALIFAFLGMQRWQGIANVNSKVTGARKDTTGGCIYLPY